MKQSREDGLMVKAPTIYTWGPVFKSPETVQMPRGFNSLPVVLASEGRNSRFPLARCLGGVAKSESSGLDWGGCRKEKGKRMIKKDSLRHQPRASTGKPTHVHVLLYTRVKTQTQT